MCPVWHFFWSIGMPRAPWNTCSRLVLLKFNPNHVSVAQLVKSYGPSYSLLYRGQWCCDGHERQCGNPFTKFVQLPNWSPFTFWCRFVLLFTSRTVLEISRRLSQTQFHKWFLYVSWGDGIAQPITGGNLRIVFSENVFFGSIRAWLFTIIV